MSRADRDARADPEDALRLRQAQLAEDRALGARRFAVLGGAFGELAALEAAFALSARLGLEAIVSLGAETPFGPDGLACLELTRTRATVALNSIYEFALLGGAVSLEPAARPSVAAARASLSERLRSGLAGAPTRHEREGIAMAWGSPREPFLVFLTDALTPAELRGDRSPRARSILAGLKGPIIIGGGGEPFLYDGAALDAAPERASLPGGPAVIATGSVSRERGGPPSLLEVTARRGGALDLRWREVEL